MKRSNLSSVVAASWLLAVLPSAWANEELTKEKSLFKGTNLTGGRAPHGDWQVTGQVSVDPATLNHVRRNLGWRCGELFRRAPSNLDAQDNAMLGEREFTWEARDFHSNRPGFDPIPIAEIGLYRDVPFRPE